MFWNLTYDFDTEGCYGYQAWAETESDAREIAKKLGFQYSGRYDHKVYEMRPSRLMKKSTGLYHPDILHATCFLSFLADCTGENEAGSLISDESALHSLIHYHGGTNNTLYETKVVRRLLDLEKLVPGLPPAHIELPILTDR